MIEPKNEPTPNERLQKKTKAKNQPNKKQLKNHMSKTPNTKPVRNKKNKKNTNINHPFDDNDKKQNVTNVFKKSRNNNYLFEIKRSLKPKIKKVRKRKHSFDFSLNYKKNKTSIARGENTQIQKNTYNKRKSTKNLTLEKLSIQVNNKNNDTPQINSSSKYEKEKEKEIRKFCDTKRNQRNINTCTNINNKKFDQVFQLKLDFNDKKKVNPKYTNYNLSSNHYSKKANPENNDKLNTMFEKQQNSNLESKKNFNLKYRYMKVNKLERNREPLNSSNVNKKNEKRRTSCGKARGFEDTKKNLTKDITQNIERNDNKINYHSLNLGTMNKQPDNNIVVSISTKDMDKIKSYRKNSDKTKYNLQKKLKIKNYVNSQNIEKSVNNDNSKIIKKNIQKRFFISYLDSNTEKNSNSISLNKVRAPNSIKNKMMTNKNKYFPEETKPKKNNKLLTSIKINNTNINTFSNLCVKEINTEKPHTISEKKTNYTKGINKIYKLYHSLQSNDKINLNSNNTTNKEIDIIFKKKLKKNKTPDKYCNIRYIRIDDDEKNNTPSVKYYYTVFPGNNGKLVERCLRIRNTWDIADQVKSKFSNLIWTPLSSQINFQNHSKVEANQLVNHFEFHSELTNKANTFINLLKYCELNEIDLFTFYPLTIILNFTQDNLTSQIEGFKKCFLDLPNLIDNNDNCNNNFINKSYNNYFHITLSRKMGSFQKMKIPATHFIGKNLWVTKRSNLNRGREIKVLSNIDEIIKEINNKNEEKKSSTLIIQKYIEEPLLYCKRKFDIRIWVLFTYITKDTKPEVYVFKEGHLKACSDIFDIDSSNLFIHLTNYSVQKHNINFSKTEIGNEISFELFQNELNKNWEKVNFKKDIFPKIIKIISITANAVKGRINLIDRKNCFEIFGYDFILDKNYNPFLLEINTNPGYEESSPLIKQLVPRMINDAFRLTVDRIFAYSKINNNNDLNMFKVDGYNDEEIMWQKIKTKL